MRVMVTKKSLILPLISLIFIFGFFGVVSAVVTSITVTSPNGGEFWSGTQSITWTASGSDSDRVDILYNSGSGSVLIAAFQLFNAGSFSWDTTGVSDGGNYKIIVAASNDIGVNDISDNVFTIDNTSPTVNAGDDKIANAGFTQNGAVSDNNLDSIEWTKVLGPGTVIFGTPNAAVTTISANTDGNYVLRLTATDKAGNSAFDEMTLSWDTTPPAVDSFTFDGEAADVFFNPSIVDIAITATEPVEWVSAKIVKVDDPNVFKTEFPGNDEFATTSFTWDGSLSSGGPPPIDGEYKILVHITDLAGNDIVDLELTPFHIFVDTQNPTISALSNPVVDTVHKTGVPIPITFTPTDPASGTPLTCGYKVGAAGAFISLGSCTSGVVFTGVINESELTDGRNDIFGIVTDSAGNTAETSSVSIIFDNDNTLSVPSDFTTIQAAIDAASSGDTIQVAAGTYTESFITCSSQTTMLCIDKSLTLRGDPGDATVGPDIINAPIIDGAAQEGSAIAFTVGVSGVTIEGFEIRNFINPPLPSMTGGIGSGILAWNTQTSGITIQDNNFNNLGWNGVLVGSDDGTIQSNWLVQRNLISDADYAGVEFTNVVDSQILNNDVTIGDGISWDPGDSGVGIEVAVRDHGTGVTAGTNVLVEGNTIVGDGVQPERAGINILSRAYVDAATALLQTVTINNNTVTGAERGIFITAESRSSGDATISGLVITNNVVDSNKDGIVIHDFLNGGTTATHSGITITDNQIINSTGTSSGIHLLSGTSATGILVNENTIINNALKGINNEGTGTLNAENNWWGDLDPSNQVSANVDFDPFAEDNTFTRFFAPVLNAIGDKPINDEGSLLTFTVTASDLDVVDTLTYSANNLPAGASFDVNTQVFTWIPTDNGVFNNVEFKVTDGFIEVSELITITVSNVVPVVEAGVDQTVDEGDLVTIGPTFTDAGSADTHTATVDWGDGSPVENLGSVISPISATHTYVDNNNYIVTITLTDDDSGVGTSTLTVTVKNVAPIASATPNTTGAVIGEIILFTGSQTDPGSADTFNYLWDFGDTQTSTLQNPTHSYSSGGTYIVNLTVTDDDGGSGISSNIEITVNDLIWELDSTWNLVSVPKTLVDNSVPSNQVWEYNGNVWVRPETIESGIGYWVDNTPLTILGLDYATQTSNQTLPSETIILEQGWNLIGHMCTSDQLVETAFPSNIYSNLFVLRYEETTDSFEIYATQGTSATFDMVPGEGYWVFVPVGNLAYTNTC